MLAECSEQSVLWVGTKRKRAFIYANKPAGLHKDLTDYVCVGLWVTQPCAGKLWGERVLVAGKKARDQPCDNM